MEALALFDFDATQSDELSFKRGHILKILDMKTDQNWYTAEREGEEGLVPKPYIEMKDHAWWYGKTPRAEAERILHEEGCNDGFFIVRDSEANPGDFSVSVRYGTAVQHYKVLRDGEGQYFLWVMKFPSLNTLIEYHKTQSISKTHHIFLTKTPNKDSSGTNPAAAPKNNVGNAAPLPPVHTNFKSPPQQISQPPAPQPPRSNNLFCEVLYDFNPQNDDELHLQKGDRVEIIKKPDEHWWEGKLRGRSGMLPANYVRVID